MQVLCFIRRRDAALPSHNDLNRITRTTFGRFLQGDLDAHLLAGGILERLGQLHEVLRIDVVGHWGMLRGRNAIDAEFSIGAVAGEIDDGVAEVVVLGAAGDIALARLAIAEGGDEGGDGGADVDDA